MPCAKLNIALTAYIASTNTSILPIYSKSIPPVPCIFAIRPSARPVVALPSILGPITLNTVDAAANSITRNICILNLPIYDISFFIDPLKFLDFWGGTIAPGRGI